MMLIDTNIFVDHLRNYKPAVHFCESIAERDDIIFSAITETEFLIGKVNDDAMKREKLLHFLNRWNKKVVDNPISLLAGDMGRKYGLAVPDAIIAATALINNAELMTKNTRDFRKVKELGQKSPY